MKRFMASEMSDDTSELGVEIPASSASSASNYDAHISSETHTVSITSGTEDSNSCTLEPSSSETDSYMSSGLKGKEDDHGSAELRSPSKEDDADDGGTKDKYPLRPGIIWKKGERLEAMDYLQKWYPAKIIEIDEAELSVRIHFEGWNQRYDEWVDMKSDHLRPLTRHSERWNRQRRKRQKSEYKVGDKVLAKWTDCKMYLAKIAEVYSDGSYGVLFYDGFKKTIQAINLSPAPSEQKQPKFMIKPPVLSNRDLKKLKNKPLGDKEKCGTSSSTCVANSQPGERAQRTHSGPYKKNKLIVAGSLFAKRNKSDDSALGFRKNKEMRKSFTRALSEQLKAKPEVKIETKEEETAEKEEKSPATPGAEAGCQTDVTNTEKPSPSPAKKEKRAGSFPPMWRRKRKHLKVPDPLKVSEAQKVLASSPVLKKRQSTDGEERPVEEKVPLSAPPLLTLPSVPPKAFVVEEDHNSYKCAVLGCVKSFRKASLLESHMKYYHSEEGPQSPTIPRRRKKTPSMCSTDSETSMSSKSTTAKRRRHVSEVSTVASLGSPDLAVKISFDDEETVGSNRRLDLGVLEEAPGAEVEEEIPEEVVNCKCGLNEENGFMIQCDVCMCWQHTLCFNMDDRDLDSITSYVCQICKQTPGVRDSARHLYDMDWFRHGRLPTFSYLQQDPSQQRQKEVLATHNTVGDVLKVQRMLHGLRQQIAVTREKDHPELGLWKPVRPKATRSLGVSTTDSRPNHAGAITCSAHSRAGSAGRGDGDSPDADLSSPSKNPPAPGTEKLRGLADKLGESQAKLSQAPAAAEITPSNGGPRVENSENERRAGQSMEVCGEDQVNSAQLEPDAQRQASASAPEDPASRSVPDGLQSQGDKQDGGVGLPSVDLDPRQAGDSEPANKTTDHQARAQGSGQWTLPGQSENGASPAVKKEPADGDTEECEAAPAVLAVRQDPFADCKLSVLLHVRSVQDDLAARLDGIETQIAAMERREFGEEAACSYGNIPALKHVLYRIARDLDKVKGIAMYR